MIIHLSNQIEVIMPIQFDKRQMVEKDHLTKDNDSHV